MSHPHETGRALALLLFTEKFSLLIESGVNALTCLNILEQEALPPYAQAAGEMHRLVANNHYISEAMSLRTDLFSPLYLGMVRAGEIGGILDKTLRLTANMLRDDIKFSRLIAEHHGGVSGLMSNRLVDVPDFAYLAETERSLAHLLFCRAFAMMLTVGIPLVQAMESVATLLPTQQRQKWVAVKEAMKTGSANRISAPFLPRFMQKLIEIGEDAGILEHMLDKTADFFQHELEAKLWLIVGAQPTTEIPIMAEAASPDQMQDELDFFLQALGDSQHSADAHHGSEGEEVTMRLINSILGLGFARSATGIFFDVYRPDEAATPCLRVQFRVEGQFCEIRRMPLGAAGPLLMRLKVMAGMDNAERAHPQRGIIHVTRGVEACTLHVVSAPNADRERLSISIEG